MNERFLFEKKKMTPRNVVDDSHAAKCSIDKTEKSFVVCAEGASPERASVQGPGRGVWGETQRQAAKIFTQPGGETWH